MKKLLTIALSLVMIFSMTAVSFADVTDDAEKTHSDMSNVTITKHYVKVGSTANSPKEEFNFNIVRTNVSDAASGVTKENMPIPTIEGVEFESSTSEQSQNITVSLPMYTSVGIYTYTITEDATNATAGVDYYSTPIRLVVTVAQDDNGLIRVAAVHTETGTGAIKSNEITNTYSAGKLTITKNVVGLLGDRSKTFEVDVTFTKPAGETIRSTITTDYVIDGNGNTLQISPNDWSDQGTYTTTVEVTDDTVINFNNIPYGVTYSVQEKTYADYETTYQYSDDGATKTINSDDESVTIVNAKGGTIDTGIFFDNGIYIAILAIVLIAAAAFIIRKRQHRYDA
ncbi:MAG: FctA domain-containing protein [Firmicutes bacterium]|nr:FctA domain-containing protein [Bacillota bacterium]